MCTDSDLNLVDSTLEGDQSAFEKLVINYQRPILSLVLRITGNMNDAPDIAQKVFLKAGRGVDERSRAKQHEERQRRTESLQHLLHQELEEDYELAESEKIQFPLAVDTEQRKVLINPRSTLWPRARNKRELAQLVAIAFEVSMLAPASERRERFYTLLSQLLGL